MRLYIFRSEVKSDLRAFADDTLGVRLPRKFGPWALTGAVHAESAPPHGLSRTSIEASIRKNGFQLWRFIPS